MTHDKLMRQIEEIVRLNNIHGRLNTLCTKLAQSGAIDMSSLRSDSYLAAKAILSVALSDLAESTRPLSDEGRALTRNLKHF